MAKNEEFIAKIRSTRPDYNEELARHKFFLDAYAGTGGFKGTTRVDAAGYWGPGAEVYAGVFGLTADELSGGVEKHTYIDRFPREDTEKFKRRMRLAHYENHVMPVVDIPLSYLNRKGMGRTVPDGLDAFISAADGNDTTWDQMVKEIVQERAAVVGYCPVLFDMPPVADGTSVAQSRELGNKLRAMPLFPAHMLNWDTDRGGRFTWVKIQIIEESIDPFGNESYLETITLWEPSQCSIWRIRKVDNVDVLDSEMPDIIPHSFGEVPIKVLRWKPVADDHVRGLSLIESIADTSKRLFNYTSELDEHIRQAVFAMLQVPTKDAKNVGTLMTGNGNACIVDPDSRRDYKWLSPDMACAEILQDQKVHARQEIYRQGKSEFTQTAGSTGGAAKSGLSRAYEFETANRSIADFAGRVSSWDTKCLTLAAKVLGVNPEGIQVLAPTKFAVEEMLQELTEASAALDLGLGATATLILKRRIVDKLLPHLEEAERDAIVLELKEMSASDGREDTLRGAADDEFEDDNDEDEDE